jgi:hypothetical protein
VAGASGAHARAFAAGAGDGEPNGRWQARRGNEPGEVCADEAEGGPETAEPEGCAAVGGDPGGSDAVGEKLRGGGRDEGGMTTDDTGACTACIRECRCGRWMTLGGLRVWGQTSPVNN